MAFITADRVLDSSTSTGTGPFVVSGTPAAGYRTFSAVMSVNDTCYYSIQGQTTSEWDVGLGTYSSANTLTRTTVYSSSNSGSAVTFSAGTKNVFITMVASKSPQLDPTGNVTALGTPASATLTNATGLSLTTGVTGVLPPTNGGSLAWQSVQTGNFTAVAGNAYPVNTTSGAVTVTLPASPTAGQLVQVTDYAGTWTTNNVTVSRNGLNINGVAANYTLNVSRGSAAFVYIDATQGWVVYSAFSFPKPSVYAASYLVVAGGASGGSSPFGGYNPGGGGAGGLLTSTATLYAGTTYTIVVGAGGAAPAVSSSAFGNNGSDSSISILPVTATGGGGGSGGSNIPSSSVGRSGGSGGGGGGGSTGGAGGSGTSGQGFAGGTGQSGSPFQGAGGGGAGAVGSNGAGSGTGNGGAGVASSITGLSVTYAGGGGGSAIAPGTPGSGGAGGGGTGSNAIVNGTAGTSNTGSGGGAGASTGTLIGGNGGSGIVILSIPTVNYSGTYTNATVTTSGSNTIIKFTASGSYTA